MFPGATEEQSLSLSLAGATEEQAEVGEEPVEVAETRISLTNVVGSVFRAHRLQILIAAVECFLEQVWNLRPV